MGREMSSRIETSPGKEDKQTQIKVDKFEKSKGYHRINYAFSANVNRLALPGSSQPWHGSVYVSLTYFWTIGIESLIIYSGTDGQLCLNHTEQTQHR